MENPAGESTDGVLRLDFDRKLTLQFRGSASHIRCRFAGPSRTRRRARTDHDGRRDARRSAHGPEWSACACRAFSAVSIWPSRRIEAGYEDVNDASHCGMIPRCAGSTAAKRLRVARPRRARWAASRRNGAAAEKTLARRPRATPQRTPAPLTDNRYTALRLWRQAIRSARLSSCRNLSQGPLSRTASRSCWRSDPVSPRLSVRPGRTLSSNDLSCPEHFHE